ncbi:MAG: hypothetical protein JRI80_19550 [Deltaproteobacteria bacterium]|nr:hypothetical protein [Deltaproteobacteria bacterium]
MGIAKKFLDDIKKACNESKAKLLKFSFNVKIDLNDDEGGPTNVYQISTNAASEKAAKEQIELILDGKHSGWKFE